MWINSGNISRETNKFINCYQPNSRRFFEHHLSTYYRDNWMDGYASSYYSNYLNDAINSICIKHKSLQNRYSFDNKDRLKMLNSKSVETYE